MRVLTPGTLTEDEALDPRASNFLLARAPAGEGAAPARGRPRVGRSLDRALPRRRRRRRRPGERGRAHRNPPRSCCPRTRRRHGDRGAAPATSRPHVRSRSSRPGPPRPRAPRARSKEHFRVASLKGFGSTACRRRQAAAGAVLEYLRDDAADVPRPRHAHRAPRPARARSCWARTTRRRLDLVAAFRRLPRRDAARGARPDAHRHGRTHAPRVDPRAADGHGGHRAPPRRRRGVREGRLPAARPARGAGRASATSSASSRAWPTNRANARDLPAPRAEPRGHCPPCSALLDGAYSTHARRRCANASRRFEDLAGLLARAHRRRAARHHHRRRADPRGLRRRSSTSCAASPRREGPGSPTYQAREAERTGIPKLKVGFNRVFGYYIEVTHAHRDKVPDDYHRKQTLTNAERYITPELKEYEEKVLRADERARDLEHRLFRTLRERGRRARSPSLQARGRGARGARRARLPGRGRRGAATTCVPRSSTTGRWSSRDGRHPVVEHAAGERRPVRRRTTRTSTASDRIALITGPNMAGKSTYIRQTALIVLMAQIGSFVPAPPGAHRRLRPHLHARRRRGRSRPRAVDLHGRDERGRPTSSTTPRARSLVILDEVGRGTSTFDGIAIAWAITEYLPEVIGARTLFATHYHELTRLADELDVRPEPERRRARVGRPDRVPAPHRGGRDRSLLRHPRRAARGRARRRRGAGARDPEGPRGRATRTRWIASPSATRPRAPQDLQLGLFAPPPPSPVVEELARPRRRRPDAPRGAEPAGGAQAPRRTVRVSAARGHRQAPRAHGPSDPRDPARSSRREATRLRRPRRRPRANARSFAATIFVRSTTNDDGPPVRARACRSSRGPCRAGRNVRSTR